MTSSDHEVLGNLNQIKLKIRTPDLYGAHYATVMQKPKK